ncbi:hypothetical protein [Anaerotignum sp.]
MNEFINVSIMMCENADLNTRTIKNFFDGIKFDNGSQKTFYVVTLLNGSMENERKFDLHYYIQNKKTGKYMKFELLGIEPIEEKKDGLIHTFSTMYFTEVKAISFPEPGDYQIKVFYKDENSAEQIDDEDLTMPSEGLKAVFNFEVTD